MDILGTTYAIIIVNDKDSEEYDYLTTDDDQRDDNIYGICDDYIPQIVVLGDIRSIEDQKKSTIFDNTSISNRIKCTMRHEVIHAFLNQSGLMQCASSCEDAWAENEEMVDFFALQFPKMQRVFKQLGVSEDDEVIRFK